MLGESANVSTQKRLRRQSAMRLALDGPAGGRHRVIGHGQSVYGLMRDTGATLFDINPDRRMAKNVRHAIEDRSEKAIDLHVWRVGPGHMSAVVSVSTSEPQRDSRFDHAVLERFKGLSHVTVEVQPSKAAA